LQALWDPAVDVSSFPKQKCRQQPYYDKVMRQWDRDHARFVAGDPLPNVCALIVRRSCVDGRSQDKPAGPNNSLTMRHAGQTTQEGQLTGWISDQARRRLAF